jgi:GT2 family glycosyltransferase
MTLDRFAYLAEPHHQILETLCAEALERGDLSEAFWLSDRRCRIRPFPDAHSFVLRAEALYRMGERLPAIRDLEAALEISPEDLAANRRMLSWGRPAAQLEAARVLIDCEHDFRALRQAIGLLCKCGKSAFASLQTRGDKIEGWAAWKGDTDIRLTVADEAASVEHHFGSNSRHPLSPELGKAISIKFPNMPGKVFSVTLGGDVLAQLRTGDPVGELRPASLTTGGVSNAGDAGVTLVVPVYKDYRATKACLEALLGHLDRTRGCRVVIVSDASPDRRIRGLLRRLPAEGRLSVLTLAENRGFAGAVNCALREIAGGDVILLNADTILPEGFIDRLTAAAHSSSDIGTVTPLSNNGELMSFPVPNRANAVGDATEVEHINQVAGRVNASVVIDIPNGIGFCLYIKRACLDAVGALSETYRRGYMEDVDFCLRARLLGFRNVCAPSVYVGHIGSRSFRKQKRSLVVRNLRILEQRFPDYRSECADFVLADPLKPARHCLELGLLASRPRGVLLVTPSGAVGEVARERARREHSCAGKSVLIMEIGYGPRGAIARLRDADNGAPQSLDVVLSTNEPTELIGLLRQVQLDGIEIFDPRAIPTPIVDAITGLGVAYDLFFVQVPEPNSVHAVVAGARRVLVPAATAAKIASPAKHSAITVVAPAKRAQPRPVVGNTARLGLLPIRRCAREHQFIRELIARLAAARPDLEIVVLGAMPDDLELLRAGAFVTGPIEASELNQLFRRYRLDRIVICMVQPLFGHPMLSSAHSGALPVAYIDWSESSSQPRDGDLVLDREASAETAVRRVLPWLENKAAA